MTIPKDTIGALIGPGGKIIQKIQEETGSVILIEEADGVGIVDVSAVNKESIDAAVKRIKEIADVPEVGKIYKGPVKSITNFGAFIEFMPGKEGLLHISEIEWRRINSVSDVLKEGEEIEVKLIDIDQKSGFFRLSRKVLLPRPDKKFDR